VTAASVVNVANERAESAETDARDVSVAVLGKKGD
jgi:hypothetical protein